MPYNQSPNGQRLCHRTLSLHAFALQIAKGALPRTPGHTTKHSSMGKSEQFGSHTSRTFIKMLSLQVDAVPGFAASLEVRRGDWGSLLCKGSYAFFHAVWGAILREINYAIRTLLRLVFLRNDHAICRLFALLWETRIDILNEQVCCLCVICSLIWKTDWYSWRIITLPERCLHAYQGRSTLWKTKIDPLGKCSHTLHAIHTL